MKYEYDYFTFLPIVSYFETNFKIQRGNVPFISRLPIKNAFVLECPIGTRKKITLFENSISQINKYSIGIRKILDQNNPVNSKTIKI